MPRYQLTLTDYKIICLILVWAVTMHLLLANLTISVWTAARAFALGVLTVAVLLLIAGVIQLAGQYARDA